MRLLMRTTWLRAQVEVRQLAQATERANRPRLGDVVRVIDVKDARRGQTGTVVQVWSCDAAPPPSTRERVRWHRRSLTASRKP
eukprot:3411463-Prymnesium_polylepis.1